MARNTGKPNGRPPKHKPDDVKAKIDAYFAHQDAEGRPYTVTGLARALGMDREQLIYYGKKEEFSAAIKEAKAKCHEFAEERLFSPSCTGVIFNLKNNWGWKDKSEIEATVTTKRSIDDYSTDELLEMLVGDIK